MSKLCIFEITWEQNVASGNEGLKNKTNLTLKILSNRFCWSSSSLARSLLTLLTSSDWLHFSTQDVEKIFSLSLSLSSLCLSLSLLSLSLSLSVNVCLSLFSPLSLSGYVCVSLLSLFLSLYLSLYVSLSLSLSLFFSLLSSSLTNTHIHRYHVEIRYHRRFHNTTCLQTLFLALKNVWFAI